jgi:hypothetical protein
MMLWRQVQKIEIRFLACKFWPVKATQARNPFDSARLKLVVIGWTHLLRAVRSFFYAH